MILVMPTTTGVLVGIDPGALIKSGTKRRLALTADDLHRFEAAKRLVAAFAKETSVHISEN